MANYLPQIALAPLAGKWVDAGDPRNQIVIGRLLVAFGSACVATWVWAVGGTHNLPGPWPVVVPSTLVGIGFVLGGPATHALVAQLVRPGEMAAATTLNSVAPMTVGRAAAPAAAGLIILHLGATAAFATAAALNLAYVVLILMLRLPRPGAPPPKDESTLRAALRYVRRTPTLVLLLVGITAVGIGQEPSASLAPPLAEALGGGPQLAGWLGTSHGLGVGLGLLVFPIVRQLAGLSKCSSWGLATVASGLGLGGWAWCPTAALAGMCLSGVGMTVAFTSITTQLQETVAPAFRGRVMSLWFIGFLGARPLAALAGGAAADAVSVRWAMTAVAITVVAMSVVSRPRDPQPAATVPRPS